MCAARRNVLAAVVLSATIVACGPNGRTGTNFCRQLRSEMPAIGEPIATPSDATTMVRRYKRLLKVAPLTIQKDFATLTNLLDMAASANPNKTDELQAVADAAYAANAASRNVVAWVKDTCAVDISTGASIPPPRKPIPTTTVVTTTTVETPTTIAPTTTNAP